MSITSHPARLMNGLHGEGACTSSHPCSSGNRRNFVFAGKMQIHLVMKNLITILAFLAGFTFSANSQDIEKQAPAGFDSVRAGIPNGKIDTIKYYSKTV